MIWPHVQNIENICYIKFILFSLGDTRRLWHGTSGVGGRDGDGDVGTGCCRRFPPLNNLAGSRHASREEEELGMEGCGGELLPARRKLRGDARAIYHRTPSSERSEAGRVFEFCFQLNNVQPASGDVKLHRNICGGLVG